MKIKIPGNLRHLLTLNNGALIIAALIALSWLWGTVATLQKNFALQQQVDALDQEVQITEIENANLGFEQRYYRSDEYLELSARDKLGRAAPGESVIILPPTPAPPETINTAQVPRDIEPSNLQQWMRFFFGGRGSQG